MRPFYENPLLRRINGDALRPGGTEITRRGLGLCRERFGLRAGARVLDLGCGPGVSLQFLAETGFQAVGLDCKREFLIEDTPRSRPESVAATVGPPLRLAGDMRQLPLTAGAFDAVLCECVLSLAQEPAAVFAGIARVLKAGGLLLFSDFFLREIAQSQPVTGRSAQLGQPAQSGQSAQPVQPTQLGQPVQSAQPGDPRGLSCTAGARLSAAWEAQAAAAGLKMVFFEDHSRAAARLAAQLIWYGPDKPAGKIDNTAAFCACTAAAPGYGLWIARKEAPCTP